MQFQLQLFFKKSDILRGQIGCWCSSPTSHLPVYWRKGFLYHAQFLFMCYPISLQYSFSCWIAKLFQSEIFLFKEQKNTKTFQVQLHCSYNYKLEFWTNCFLCQDSQSRWSFHRVIWYSRTLQCQTSLFKKYFVPSIFEGEALSKHKSSLFIVLRFLLGKN